MNSNFSNLDDTESVSKENWKNQTIESLCTTITSGGTPLRSISKYYENGTIDWFKTKELKDWYIEDSEEKITVTALNNSSAKLFPKNTVLIAMYGDGRTITSLGILRKEAATNQACCAMIADPTKCDHLFLFYSLKFYRNHLIKLASGGAQRNLNTQIIRKFPIKVPPLPVQRKISNILSTYDYLIENNTRRIRILEEMAQTIYREWFVNFRFPGHEGVRMVESSMGKIPEGWRIGRLEEALLLQRGFDLPNSQRMEGNTPIYAATGIVGYHNEFKAKGPGIVTGRSGSLGTVIYVDDDYWPLNTTLWVKEFRSVTPFYAYYLLCGLGLEKYNSGAAVPTLNRNDVFCLQVVIPEKKYLNHFDTIVKPLYSLKKILTRKNDNLCKQRDLHLPRLINREI